MGKEKDLKCKCGDECTCEEGKCECGDECTCENCHEHNKPLIIEMEDVDGNKVNVEVVATFEDNKKNYAIVNDLDNVENSYIFEIKSTKDGDILQSIDDEKEFERLCKVIEDLTE